MTLEELEHAQKNRYLRQRTIKSLEAIQNGSKISVDKDVAKEIELKEILQKYIESLDLEFKNL